MNMGVVEFILPTFLRRSATFQEILSSLWKGLAQVPFKYMEGFGGGIPFERYVIEIVMNEKVSGRL